MSLTSWRHSFTCHLTQVNTPCFNGSQTGRYSIYLPQRDGRLSWPRWLVTYRDGLPAHRQSPIQVLIWILIRLGIELTTCCWQVQHLNHYTTKPPFCHHNAPWSVPNHILKYQKKIINFYTKHFSADPIHLTSIDAIICQFNRLELKRWFISWSGWLRVIVTPCICV